MLIKPYKQGSASARALAKSLGCLRTGRLLNRSDVINWGCSDVNLTNTINAGICVAIASSKAKSLLVMRDKNVPTVEFIYDKEEAQTWIDEGHRIYCRKIDRGHGGKGIVLADKENPLVDAVVYTKYAKNKHEYRIHVFDGHVIHVQKKRRRTGVDTENKYIRNHDNGWVFCTENVAAPDGVVAAAIQAVQALGLVFGAVDIGYREKDDKAFVFEVNTAPGIEGTTVTKYVEAIKEYFNKKKLDLNRTFRRKRRV